MDHKYSLEWIEEECKLDNLVCNSSCPAFTQDECLMKVLSGFGITIAKIKLCVSLWKKT